MISVIVLKVIVRMNVMKKNLRDIAAVIEPTDESYLSPRKINCKTTYFEIIDNALMALRDIFWHSGIYVL